ncbi:hypothetical protein GSI_11643 [Ganoderma sinense ZZ0214-1]|uniref:Uncharacterized protein n=1 Tax=Ganoderma sinense ZZ0214-1 TaxID=1077348 RepID=A0A2G8RWJ8_9APHY|nr:hypothetical protein GSI_11643 [Ganoderma sinense ZZ0214-1]
MNPRKGSRHTGSHAWLTSPQTAGPPLRDARGIWIARLEFGDRRVDPELYRQAAPETDSGHSPARHVQAPFTYRRGRSYASGGPAGVKPYVSSTAGPALLVLVTVYGDDGNDGLKGAAGSQVAGGCQRGSRSDANSVGTRRRKAVVVRLVLASAE